MAPKNCLCIIVDRLHPGLLGAYGNSWIRTHGLDALASQSFLFDQALVEWPEIRPFYHAVWHGKLHASGETPQSDSGPSLAAILRTAGWRATLITDEPDVAGLDAISDFDDSVFVESSSAVRDVSDPAQTAMGRLFSATTDRLRTSRQPFFLWLHARAMAGTWDAPWEFRQAYADQDDPSPPDFVDVPELRLKQDHDPDQLLGITHAYAGQVALLDQCVRSLHQMLEQSGLAASTQITFLSARGFPLGEHRRVGACDGALHNELVQLAWWMRFPDGLGQYDRTQALVTPADLPGTLMDWLGVDRNAAGWGNRTTLVPIASGERAAIRDHLHLASAHDRGFRTPAWYLRRPADGATELYAKPSDRWEVNEITKLCPEIVSGLLAATRQQEAEPGGHRQPLSTELITQVD